MKPTYSLLVHTAQSIFYVLLDGPTNVDIVAVDFWIFVQVTLREKSSPSLQHRISSLSQTNQRAITHSTNWTKSDLFMNLSCGPWIPPSWS
ncbi:hypothetical protein L3Y34_002584 [Caenorhabditis briggsae]|uniref:Uncharacterized protein n=1 Tax=Caenorhabditis briggsae TaxID=6238 RepID=A0AAE9DG77_CAEBR|nr:hypothetical protein L3Y34_002584 [Caenorhabditis briggsae]